MSALLSRELRRSCVLTRENSTFFGDNYIITRPILSVVRSLLSSSRYDILDPTSLSWIEHVISVEEGYLVDRDDRN